MPAPPVLASNAASLAAPTLDVVVPVHNEAHVLEASIGRLHEHLGATMPYSWRITVADNASSDDTMAVARMLAANLDHIRVVGLDRKGRGRALRAAWSSSDAAVMVYTDVDLSTDLDALLPLVAPLVSGHSEIAIGSRLARGASVARGPRREAISRAYNLILRSLFAVRFTDAQCGFKAVRADVAAELLPLVRDEEWFFDTELLLLADHNDMRIHEVPVDWVDDPDSRVDVLRTAAADLRGVARMAKTFLCGRGRVAGSGSPHALVDDMGRQLVTFAAIGTISTAVSLWLFLSLRSVLGAVAANAVAVGATALGNLWANHRYTFGSSGRPLRRQRRRSYMRGAAVFVGGLVASSAALLGVQAAGGHLAAEVGAVLVTWGATALCRFALLRRGSDRVDLAEGSR